MLAHTTIDHKKITLVKCKSGECTQFNTLSIYNRIVQLISRSLRKNRPRKKITISLTCPHSKKTSLTRKHKKRNIFQFLRTDCFSVKMVKIWKVINLRKEKLGLRSIQESKLQAKLAHLARSVISIQIDVCSCLINFFFSARV